MTSQGENFFLFSLTFSRFIERNVHFIPFCLIFLLVWDEHLHLLHLTTVWRPSEL